MTRISNKKSDLGREGQVKMVPLPFLIVFFFFFFYFGCAGLSF